MSECKATCRAEQLSDETPENMPAMVRVIGSKTEKRKGSEVEFFLHHNNCNKEQSMWLKQKIKQPSNHHFHRWYKHVINHFQSWVVYGIVFPAFFTKSFVSLLGGPAKFNRQSILILHNG
jgi:hypothetical protein